MDTNTALRSRRKSVFVRQSNAVRQQQMWSFLTLVDSTLCGMVALCAGCNIIETYGAFVIGVLAAFVYMGIEKILLKLQIDDPLGSVATHLGGGLLGLLMTPFFMIKEYSGLNGIFYWEGCPDVLLDQKQFYDFDDNGKCRYSPFYQLGWTFFGATVIMGWTTLFCVILFTVLWKLDILRLDMDTEIRGIDIKVHGEQAYPETAYGHGWDNNGDFSLQIMTDKITPNTSNNPGADNDGQTNMTQGLSQGGLIELALKHHSRDLHRLKNSFESQPEEEYGGINFNFADDDDTTNVFDEDSL